MLQAVFSSNFIVVLADVLLSGEARLSIKGMSWLTAHRTLI
jgi:hypothetical protein